MPPGHQRQFSINRNRMFQVRTFGYAMVQIIIVDLYVMFQIHGASRLANG